MTLIIPTGQTAPVKSSPLEFNETIKKEMVLKAKELLDKPMDSKELLKKLEHYYIFTEGEHYQSNELIEVVEQVMLDLAPKEEVIEKTI